MSIIKIFLDKIAPVHLSNAVYYSINYGGKVKIDNQKTCFSNCKRNKELCKNTSCRSWFESKDNLNCAVIAAEAGPMTLQKIGDLFGLTRMRICQIEKNAIKKIRENFMISQK